MVGAASPAPEAAEYVRFAGFTLDVAGCTLSGADGQEVPLRRAEFALLLARHADTLAAVVIEPLVQGAAGMITAPEGYLRRIREETRRYEVLLIADEVAVDHRVRGPGIER